MAFRQVVKVELEVCAGPIRFKRNHIFDSHLVDEPGTGPAMTSESPSSAGALLVPMRLL